MEKISNRISGLSEEALQGMARLLVDDHQAGADLVFSAVLRQLEAVMAEPAFIAFCDGL